LDYFVKKTGFDMFDVLRAYGLAHLLRAADAHGVTIQQTSYEYTISSQREPRAKIDKQMREDLLKENRYYGILATQRKQEVRRGLLKDIRNSLTQELGDIFSWHTDKRNSPVLTTEKGSDIVTIPQSMDVSASKGMRETKLGAGYNEGGQIGTDRVSWTVAAVGAAFYQRRENTTDSSSQIALTFDPIRVNLLHDQQIRKDLAQTGLCCLSTLTIICHWAVRLAYVLSTRKSSYGGFTASYDAVLFNSSQSVGRKHKQLKPSGGGRFGIEHLLSLTNTPSGQQAIDKINRLFERSSSRETSGVAFALAEYIHTPSLANFSRYAELHLRNCLVAESHKKSRSYPRYASEEIEALLQIVSQVS